MAEYKNWFTLDGRLPLRNGVTEAKVKAMSDLVEKTVRGNGMAAATLRETMTTSDAPYSFVQVVNLNTFQDFDEAPRVWNQIATTRSVSNFENITFYTLNQQWEDGVLGDGEPRHISPIVPETVPYPYANLAGESFEGNKLVKRGFKVGFSWEMFINDTVGYIRDLPSQIRQVALDTEEYEVFNALVGGVGASQQLQAGTNVDGTTYLANDLPTREAIMGAIEQLGQREINGRKIVVRNGFNLIVAPGQKGAVEWQINNRILVGETVGTGPEYQFATGGANPLSGITVIESEYVALGSWYLVPKIGQRRPVLELARLVGHEAPDLRINSPLNGVGLDGSRVGEFAGGFDNDTIDLRVRQVLKGLNWSADMIIWSNGSKS